MNEKIRKEILHTLTEKPTCSRYDMLKSIARLLSVQEQLVAREIRLMLDEGVITNVGHADQESPMANFRLTSEGVLATASLKTRICKYLRLHWIAIVALLLSLIALFE